MFRNLSLAYYNHLDRKEKAREVMEKAFCLDPTDSRVFFERDQLLKKFKVPAAERLTEYEKYRETALERDDAFIEYVTLHNLTGHYEKAYELLLSRNDQNEGTAFIPNEEIRAEFEEALEETKWNELTEFQGKSERLLKATLNMEEDIVAESIEKIHSQFTPAIQYHDENSLSSVLTVAYLSAMQYYFIPVREMPSGRGFADYVFIPKPEYVGRMPALVIELKWNKNAETALRQIKEKQYTQAVEGYTGEILLVGVTYDKKSGRHRCLIEKSSKGTR